VTDLSTAAFRRLETRALRAFLQSGCVDRLEGVSDHVLLRRCRQIDRQRAAGDLRAFAHVDHFVREPATICVADDLARQVFSRRWGVYAHEIGHLCDRRQRIPGLAAFVEEARQIYPTLREARHQARANALAQRHLGLDVSYDASDVQAVMNFETLRVKLQQTPGVPPWVLKGA
jgi:hypothetical protein